jgi:hypothetical protein
VVNDLFDVLLNSVCQYFIEDFCIDVYSGDWPIVLFFGGVFAWFGISVKLAVSLPFLFHGTV